MTLDLAAFGPFTDRSLDLAGGAPGGLHVIYGRNAAGKSSALRAISDLLFGIPQKSLDDHVHPYATMRIRAKLESASGEAVTVQRLKRNKDSLRDEQDAPVDELVLRRLLGSVDRLLFERVFGLDHERLRDAGVALLEGGGDVGESLFDAGAGGQGVRRVLARLREEADVLFKPRGGKQEIAQLLESYKSARERVRNSAHTPEAYAEQQRELERHREDRENFGRQLSELRGERERARNLQSALKGIAKREKLLQELAALGGLPDLPADFGERRERVQRSILAHQTNIERATRELLRLEQRARDLNPPLGLLSVGEGAITALREGIGSTKKALLDLPSREAQLAKSRAEAEVMERHLGIDSTHATLEALSARRPEEARFRKLFAERARLAERCRAARDQRSRTELEHDTRVARRKALDFPVDLESLERAVVFARQCGDVEGALAAAEREQAELALRSRAELAMLTPFDGSLAELCTLRVPSGETVEHFERTFAELEERRKRTVEAALRCREREAELERELAAEERSGAVPSEEELERARRTRDERFDELCRAWPEKPGKALSLFESARVREYRGHVNASDALADRLRREAARVAENARKAAERGQLVAERERLREQEAALVADLEELGRKWASSWAAAGFEPVRPTEMRGWLVRREHAVSLVVKDAAIAQTRADLQRRAAELDRALSAVVGPDDVGSPLAVRVERAVEKLEQARRIVAERAALSAQIAEAEIRRAAARQDLELAEAEAASREKDLSQVIAALGFDPALAPDDVDARLDALGDLTRVREATSELERRVLGMRRDVRAFQADVEALVAAHAPDLAGLPAQDAAGEIVARFDRGRRDAEALAGLEEDIEERRAELAEQTALLERARADAQTLLALAQVSDLADLPLLEQRTARGRELRAELDGLEVTLTETAGPGGLPRLLAEASSTDPARVAARLEDLEAQIAELEERLEDSIRNHQRTEAGLERFSDTSAVDAAEEERALAAAIVTRSERWAKLKLAEVLLAREIERYREQNQGPVLRRASELYARLTREEFRGLRVGREERTLVAVRGNDVEVTVEGLNEAARYHLYLALRLASLERYLAHAEPLPLVLDDVLIHFDDEGARAALSVLGELSSRVQVLLFTHHRHNLALARAAVPEGRLFVHEL